MVKTKKTNSKPDRSTPRLTRTATVTGDQGHTANGLLASSGLASESEHPPENTRTQRTITKKRKQWISSENREVLMCYFKSEPSRRGYRKRFHALWIEHHPESDICEQRLADQQKTIIRNNWFSETEIDEIKRHANSRNVTTER